MKELTVQEKAKAYNEAIERAKKLMRTSTAYDKFTIEKIFPELKEEMNKKIKACIKMCLTDANEQRFKDYNTTLKDCLEWLENQEHISETHLTVQDDKSEEISKEIIKYLEQTVPHHHRDEVLKSKKWIDWLEKQDNQKSKKVSIWNHWKDGICGNGDGKLIYLIKDGDDYSLSSSLAYECDYIVLSDLDKLMVQEKQGEPADKIEQKQDAVIQINPSEYINDMGGNGCYLKNATQVSAWTEDDKKHMANILTTLLMEAKNAKTEQYRSIVESDIDWIYSLKNKDRVQPKQWCGEEDEHRIKLLEALCEDKLLESVPNSTMYGEMRTTIDWLKSLRNRITWKPTEEQLKSLQEVIDVGHFTSYPNVLETLYEQLEKL